MFFTPLVNHDGPRYLVAAQEIAAGHFQESLRVYSMPFYPLLIAGVHLLVDDWVRAGQLVSLVSLSLAVVPLYLLARRIFGASAAFWAGLAYTLWPTGNDLAGTVLRDPPFVLFGALAVWAGVEALGAGRKPWHFIAASVLATAACLCRMEGVLLIPLFLLAWLGVAVARPAERRDLGRGAVLFLLLPVAGVAVGSSLVGQQFDLQRFADTWQRLQHMFSGGFLANYRSVYARLREIEGSLPFGFWGGDLAEITRHHLWLIYGIGLFDRLCTAVSFLLLPFALAGLGLPPADRRTARFLLLLIGGNLLLLYLFYTYYTFLEVRYAIFSAFLLLPWIGAGLQRVADWTRRVVPKSGPALLLLLLAAAGGYKSFKGLPDGQDLTVREAGKWFAAQEELRSAPLASNDSRIPYFAGRFRSYLPLSGGEDYAAMEQVALAGGGEFLVVRTSPAKAASVPPLRHFTKVAEFTGRKHVVYLFRRGEQSP